jgi:MSHA biogenesis protein MshJ
VKKFIDLKNEVETRVDGLSVRERILIVLTLITLLYFAWENIVFKQVWLSKDTLVSQVDNVGRKIQNVHGQIEHVTSKMKTNNYYDLLKQVKLLKTQNQEMKKQISSLASQLLPPSEMTNMLTHMLQDESKIRIVSMNNIPETPLFDRSETEGGEEESQDPNQLQVYQHGIQLVIEGEYFDIMNFLENLERIPWKLIWSSLNYKVSDYPNAQVTITLYTLSLHQGWIST